MNLSSAQAPPRMAQGESERQAESRWEPWEHRLACWKQQDYARKIEKINFGFNPVLTKQAPPNLNVRETERRFLVESNSQADTGESLGVRASPWKVQSIQLGPVVSSIVKLMLLACAQLSFCGTSLPWTS